MGLLYRHGESNLVGYTDAEFKECKQTGMAVGGYVFLMAGAPVSWSSKKQTVVALSVTESEFIAAAEAAKEAKYLKDLLEEIGFPQQAICLFEDNKSVLAMAQKGVFSTRTRHIDLRYKYLLHAVRDGSVSLQYVSSTDNCADLMTKPPSSAQSFNKISALMGLG